MIDRVVFVRPKLTQSQAVQVIDGRADENGMLILGECGWDLLAWCVCLRVLGWRGAVNYLNVLYLQLFLHPCLFDN